MTLVTGFDAAFCPDPAPDQDEGYQWCEVYIGGSSAFHVWDQTERNRVADLPVLPVWVPTPGQDNPRQVALQAAAVLKAAGYPPYHKPWYFPLMWDLETGIEPDPGWGTVAFGTLHSAGYDSVIYGSVDGSHIFSWPLGPGFSGYLVAHYDGIPQLYPHANVLGKQYRADVAVTGGTVDLDVLDASVLAHLGRIT